ncbi:MAG: exosortase A [Alishewanella agri]|nr:exosortase A [Alishewanella agri]
MTQGLPLTEHNNTRPSQLAVVILGLLLLSGFVLVFWSTLLSMESIWRHSETYMHGYLIAPISLWLLYRDRDQLVRFKPQPSLLPAFLALPLLLLWLLAYSININFVSQFAAIVYLQLLLWSFFGHAFFKRYWFPIGFLIFLVPFGEAANPILQQITADLVVWMLHLIDMPVYRDGLYLHTASAVFEVAVACSGLNFLLSSLVLSCLFAYLHYQKLYKSLLFIAFVVVLSIIANGIRAFLLVVIGESTQMAYGFGADHYYYGWLVFFIVMFCSFWLGAKFADNTDTPVAAVVSSRSHPISLTTLALLLPLALGVALRYSLPLTITPDTPTALYTPADAQAANSNWGIRFYDGLSRDHWQDAQGIEYFVATYANRQDKGELITWHNTLFATDRWTIRRHQQTGDLFNRYGSLELVNVSGQTQRIDYWYQLGSVKTTNRVLVKLLQLANLWLRQDEPAILFAVATSAHETVVSPQQLAEAQTKLAAIVAAQAKPRAD